MGTQDEVTVVGWFSSAGAQLSEITAGSLMVTNAVSMLVSAMASFGSANPGFNPTEVSMAPNDATLQSVIAAAWHS